MSLSIRKFNTTDNVFERTPRFHQTEVDIEARKKRTLMQCRYKREELVSARDKTKALAGAALGTLIPMLLFSKIQKKSLWNMKYGFNEIASMAIGANVGGIAVSSIGKKRKEKEKKFNEGVFQILNSVLPMALVDGGVKLCKKFEKTNKPAYKIGASLLGVLTGTQLGIKLSNKITDPKDIIPDRKYTAKDSLANLDDVVSILVLGGFKCAEKLGLARVLPFIYTYSGYRSGTSN